MSDESIYDYVQSAKDGDAQAFSELYDMFYERIAQFAYRRTGDADVASDIAAQVFLVVVRDINKFKWKHENSFSGWLFAIASNEVKQYYRKSNRSRLFNDGEQEMLEDNRMSVHDAVAKLLDDESDTELLINTLAKLKPKQRSLITMYYLENLNSKQVAEVLGMKDGAVRTALSRALDDLRSLFESQPQPAAVYANHKEVS